ncbi:hypothetical protein [Pedobacter nyackensis]|uniref:hypothetical protein n=1 Tax=Pedobacter nyackensis TaxID=475255 RepID=UPI00292E729E|nr:hypothetical protein [Pedobacter nyackensis]
MTTTIEDNELNAELQELYLTGKQWLSDLDFFENELIFLKKLSQSNVKLPDEDNFSERLRTLTDHFRNLKTDIQQFIQTLGILTVATQKKIELSFLEDHIQLKLKIEQLLKTFRTERKAIFSLSLGNRSTNKAVQDKPTGT